MAVIQKKDLKPALLKKMNEKGDEKAPTLKDLAAMLGDAIFQMIKPESPLDLLPGGKLIQAAKLLSTEDEAEAAIRKGGRRDLYAAHDFNPYSLKDLLEQADAAGIPPQMHVMSYSIQKAPTKPLFGSATLIPKPEVLDPKNSSLVELRNRDFYTETFDASRPLTEVYINSRKGRFMQGIPKTDQAMAIEMSPKFKSFEQYEADPLGAALLDKPIREVPYAADYFRQMGVKKSTPEGTLQAINQRLLSNVDNPSRNDKLLAAMLKRFENQGSEYAEGKVNKPLALNDRNFLAAIMSPNDMQFFPGMANELEKRGIATGSVTDFVTKDQLQPVRDFALDMSKRMAELMAKASRNSTGMSYAYIDNRDIEKLKDDLMPIYGLKYNRPYVNPSFEDTSEGKLKFLDEFYESVIRSSVNSEKFGLRANAFDNILQQHWNE